MLHRYRALAGSFAGHYWTLRPFASDRYDAKRFGIQMSKDVSGSTLE